jgi:hypothetical protein
LSPNLVIHKGHVKAPGTGRGLSNTPSPDTDTDREEGLKWLKMQEKGQKQAVPEVKGKRSYVYFCAPSDDRWCKYRVMFLRIIKRLSDCEQ